MARLVFRPYTQIWRSICTSESLRASTRVSPGFTLFRHRSPPFGSRHVCSHSDLSPKREGPADCASQESNHCHFHCAPRVCHSCTRTHVWLLGPCFKTGRRKQFCQHHEHMWLPSDHPSTHLPALTPHQGVTSLTDTCTQLTWYWPTAACSAQVASHQRNTHHCNTRFLRFPFSNFRYSLTLFSKFFASFPHGTCSLSVYHQYLALDGIYHPIRAAIPNNSTRRTRLLQHTAPRHTRECHPLSCPVPRDFAQGCGRVHVSRPQFGAISSVHRFTWWALPASVALTEGILVSFSSSA